MPSVTGRNSNGDAKEVLADPTTDSIDHRILGVSRKELVFSVPEYIAAWTHVLALRKKCLKARKLRAQRKRFIAKCHLVKRRVLFFPVRWFWWVKARTLMALLAILNFFDSAKKIVSKLFNHEAPNKSEAKL